MRSLHKNFILILSILYISILLVLPLSVFTFCESDFEHAISSLESAEEALGSTYLSLLEAERAGGDISELVTYLNTALDYHSEAEKSLKSGEYENVVLLANKVVDLSNVAIESADSLTAVAENLGGIKFRNRLFLSLGVIFLTILFGFLGWSIFKGYYLRRIMALSLEAVADES